VTIRVFIVTLTMLGVGVGCTQKFSEIFNTEPPEEVVQIEVNDANRLLEYYSYISDLQGEELQREYQRAQREFVDEPSDRNRIQLVMLLSLQNTPFRNTYAANVLLQTWLGDESNAHSKLQPLATLFADYLTDVHRLDKALSSQTDMLSMTSEGAARHAQQLDAEKKWSAKLQKKYDIEKARTAALQKKLDALLEMEMNLIEREQITNPDAQ
jgi:hypothetical protein